jgi:predicted deacylase
MEALNTQEFDLARLPRGVKQTGWLDVAPRPEGSTWRLPFLYVTGKAQGPVLVVTAGVHGDEYEGVEAIPGVFRDTDPRSLKGTLFMIPVCNIPAFETITRSSPIDGLNLARTFPGNGSGSITERIAHLIATQILPDADFYIDLHSGGMMYDIPTLVGYLHDDGDLGVRSLAGARAFGAPVLWGHPLPVAPGRTLSSAVDHDVPCIYTEASGGGLARPDDVACFRNGVLNVMKSLDMIDGNPQPSPTVLHLFGDGNIDQAILAQSAGYYKPEVELLDEVRSDQLLGTIRDLLGEVVSEVRAPTDGVVIMLRRFHSVRVGDGLAHITKRHITDR